MLTVCLTVAAELGTLFLEAAVAAITLVWLGMALELYGEMNWF